MSEENTMKDKIEEAANTTQEQPVTPEDYTGMPGYEDTVSGNAASEDAEWSRPGRAETAAEPEEHDHATDSADKLYEAAASESAADQKERKKKGLFHFNKEEREFSREQWILTHIGDENLMEYLELEQRREETRQKAKDARQKRLLSAFQLAASLAAIVGVTSLLRDNPTVLVNILYIIGIVSALWIWKNPKNK
ncbi:MAG TPA: hypothetical protein H9730_05165 [Candidatus Mediterraneibacter stercoripullorum]|nr:hypothetical protein [Candidatus Mediterraneibacter stercoripullorum]